MSEVNILCLPPSFASLFFEPGSLIECRAHKLGYTAWSTNSRDPPISTPPCPSARVRYLLLLLALVLGHRDSKLAHLVWAASFTIPVLKENF